MMVHPPRAASAILAVLIGLGCDGRSTAEAPVASTPSLAPSPAPLPAPSLAPSALPASPREGEAGGIHYRLLHTAGAAAESELPLIVAIHGLGDHPDRFALLDGYPAPARVVYPRGLSPHGSGYSWFRIDVGRATAPGPETVEGVAAAADALARMIAELARRFPTRGKPIVTGFSQGGMLSFALAARHPAAVAAALPLAGYLPAPLWPSSAPEPTPPIMALHGADDPLIPVAAARDTVAGLRKVGFRAELVEYPDVPHSVSPGMLRELYRRLVEAAP
jgi:phospholipase/carboxylesterase